VRLFDHAVARALPVVPRSIVGRVAAPYIAGATLEDARRVVSELNANGMSATVDVLGEEITHPESAETIAAAYHEALAAISTDGLDANVSVKLTALGLHVDRELCRALLTEVLRDASARKIFVRIDMEDSSTTDATLELYRLLREDGQDGVGIVLQAALRRTLGDIEALSDLRPSVRLCKGIYVEPSAIAFQEREVIRKSLVACLDALVDAGCRVAVATHDEWLLGQTLDRIPRLEAAGYELQMLLGVRVQRGRELVAAGHPLRIYVPYGQQWYEYSLRRLQENPSVAGHVAKDMLGRLVPGR
jgi:proline dehydrogenase